MWIYRKVNLTSKTWKKKSKWFGHVIDHVFHCYKLLINDFHHLPNLGLFFHTRIVQSGATKELSWDCHVDTICEKVSAGIGALRHINFFFPVATLETVYKGLVQPYFEYCFPLWDTCGKPLKDKLQRFQSRAARVLTGDSYDIRSPDFIDSLSWQTLDDWRRSAKSTVMYKIFNDHPAHGLRNSFVWRNVDQTNYHPGNTVTDLTFPEPKREFLKGNFKFSGAMLWNQLGPVSRKSR